MLTAWSTIKQTLDERILSVIFTFDIGYTYLSSNTPECLDHLPRALVVSAGHPDVMAAVAALHLNDLGVNSLVDNPASAILLHKIS